MGRSVSEEGTPRKPDGLSGKVAKVSSQESSAAGVDSAHFRQVLGHFAAGVTVVAATGPDGRHVGMAVGSFFSVSLEPPLVGFCAAKTSSSYPLIEKAGAFVVNILAEDQGDMCGTFASKGADKFNGVVHSPSPVTGAPLLEGALGWIDCTLDAVHEAGDHWIVVGRVLELGTNEGLPLVFYRGSFGRLIPG